ncbi:MAG: hypothetical protein ACI4Q3_01295 [Kiritimatiellia bacterium]
MKRLVVTACLVLAAFAAAGTCLFRFWRTAVRLAAENRSLRNGCAAVRLELAREVAARKEAIARKDGELRQMAESRDELARNLRGAIKSCEGLQARIRRLTAEKAAAEKTLADERRAAREKARQEAARKEAERQSFDAAGLADLIKLTDAAPRKAAGSHDSPQ